MRSKVWSILLLGCDTSAAAVEALGPLSQQKDPTQGMNAEDARVLDADVKRTRYAVCGSIEIASLGGGLYIVLLCDYVLLQGLSTCVSGGIYSRPDPDAPHPLLPQYRDEVSNISNTINCTSI